MRTVITQRARADLREIARYIARDNRKRAITFIEELTQRCAEIADMPAAFSLVEGHEAEGIRRRVHGNYLIYYRIERATVTVVHIRSASRDRPLKVFDV